MQVLKQIGLILKELRAEKDVTLQDVANAIGSTKSMISKYERGEHEPGLSKLRKFASFYNVSLDYLFGFTLDKQPVITSEKLNELFANLSVKKKREVIRFLEFLNTTDETEE